MAANRWGLIPDIPNGKDWDIRDHVHLAAAPAAAGTNRINYMKDQRQWGSCTGFGIERALRMALQHSGLPDIDLSPLFAYYNNRLKSGLPPTQDTGASIRASVDAAREFGLCRESWWTYKNADGYLFVKPEPYAYEDALAHQVLEAYAIPNTTDTIRQALAAGFGVTYGTTVHYQSFEYAPNGDVQMPQANDSVAGAHNIVLDGWDDATARYGFGNSWGMWGRQGFGTVPYDHVAKFGFDLWAVKVVESPGPVPVAHTAVVTDNVLVRTTVTNAAAVDVDGIRVWHA
jgi:C1A family cysteine protease